MPERVPIPKKLRFEVLKRDSFKCQYCGAEAPNVLLHIDHIKPVVEGGDNNVTNLVTACAPCNLGKGATLLGDDRAMSKQRAQLDELQERHEQLEMMMEWQRGLRDLKSHTVQQLAEYWQDLAPGWSVNDHGRASIKRWLRKFSVAEITEAMNIASEQYLKSDSENPGEVSGESFEIAFQKVPAICRVTQESKEDPDIKELLYIRGILKNRLSYINFAEALQWMKAARTWDVSIEELRNIALSVSSWTRFIEALDEAIDRQKRILEDEGE